MNNLNIIYGVSMYNVQCTGGIGELLRNKTRTTHFFYFPFTTHIQKLTLSFALLLFTIQYTVIYSRTHLPSTFSPRVFFSSQFFLLLRVSFLTTLTDLTWLDSPSLFSFHCLNWCYVELNVCKASQFWIPDSGFYIL